jgi:coenzyme PQQ precursor peptide PqqA
VRSTPARCDDRAVVMEAIMAIWTAPIVNETPVGLEVTSYSPAEL